MAVFTPLNEDEINAFLKNYDLGSLKALEPIEDGIENTNYKIITAKGPFILTLIEGRTKEQELPFVFEVLRHLKKSGLPVAGPVADKNHKTISSLKNKAAVIVEFLNGESRLQPGPAECRALGDMLARMHVASDGFYSERPNPLAIIDFRAYTKGYSQSPDDIEPGLLGALEDELDYLEQNRPSNLPVGIMHGDLFPDNVLFDGDDLSGLIDFYFVSTEVLVYDLAICINCWCGEENGEVNQAKARAMVAAYQSQRKLSADEISAFPYYLRAASVRFMITRINDWFIDFGEQLVEKKDPLQYAGRMAFHQKHRDQDFYGFS